MKKFRFYFFRKNGKFEDDNRQLNLYRSIETMCDEYGRRSPPRGLSQKERLKYIWSDENESTIKIDFIDILCKKKDSFTDKLIAEVVFEENKKK